MCKAHSSLICVIFTEKCLIHDSSTISRKYQDSPVHAHPGTSMEVRFGHLWRIWGASGAGQDYSRARLKGSGLSGIMISKWSISHTGTLKSY
ncbi:hypothetical protein ARMGADRAFT_786163 [Armillaria gallica]|uniref:Uncharacterized protein n=1 Tax=Armillaria gallica TaxID=47427 RepID=A0A2H3DW40_ARMGA|nr:hypothetical protein ARMGADRAFT_786163 [Armillaria gallica]